MLYLYLVAFIAGLLLAVRLMFFGAERRRVRAGVGPLRRWEPAAVGFLIMSGVSGYLFTRYELLSTAIGAGAAVLLGVVWATLAARVAIAMAQVTPQHDPDDPRFVLQGHVALVTTGIPASGAGMITFETGAGPESVAARTIDDQPVDAGVEVCIERIEDGLAYVELWTAVEDRI